MQYIDDYVAWITGLESPIDMLLMSADQLPLGFHDRVTIWAYMVFIRTAVVDRISAPISDGIRLSIEGCES